MPVERSSGGDGAVGGRLANLLIAGVTKAGTTSLFAYLAQHPDICPAGRKGTNYFAPLRYEGGTIGPPEDYERFFAHCSGERYRMEATLSYFYGGPRLIGAIREVLGTPRVIISLRDPVDRLWSGYKMKHTQRRVTGVESFEAFIDRCEELIGRGEHTLEENRRYRSLLTGRYADYIVQWLDSFGDDCRVVFFEDLVADPPAVVSDLCAWLGIDATLAATFDYSPRNPSMAHRSPALERAATRLNRGAWSLLIRRPRARRMLRNAYVAMNRSQPRLSLRPETRERLERYYRESNAALGAALAERGYSQLPAWVARARSASEGGGAVS